MRRSYFFFLFLFLIAGALVWWQNRAGKDGEFSAPATLMFSVLRPGQKAALGVAGWVSDVGRTMFRYNDIISKNRELEGRIADLQGQNLRLQRYRKENQELKKLLDAPQPVGGKPVAAQIISFDITDYTQRIFLNIDRRHGVNAKDIVYTAHGIVGQVVNSEHKRFSFPTSEVLLLTDRRSGIGATVARSGAVGVVVGTGQGLCKLEYLDFHADVREGDVVLTSGLVVKGGGVFPEGLVIGRVSKVERDKTVSRLSASVVPEVPLQQITTVWVRTQAHS